MTRNRSAMIFLPVVWVLSITQSPLSSRAGDMEDLMRKSADVWEAAKSDHSRGDLTEATDKMLQVMDYLRQLAALAPGRGGDLIASQNNMTTLYAWEAVEKLDYRNGISSAWRDRLEKLEPPREVSDTKQFDALQWFHHVAYANLQQQVADYYARKSDYSRASYYFARAETYYAKYEAVAPSNVLADPETKRWREVNKKRLSDLIASKGIMEGMHVQNAGFPQKWIGRVMSVNGETLTIRVTYKSDWAPRGFEEGKLATLRRDEVNVVTSLSLEAALHGYK